MVLIETKDLFNVYTKRKWNLWLARLCAEVGEDKETASATRGSPVHPPSPSMCNLPKSLSVIPVNKGLMS